MMRFSAPGAYLLLVPRGRVHISFSRNNNVQNKFEEFIRLQALCFHMDIIVDKLKRRLLFL